MRSRVLFLAFLSSCWFTSPALGQGYLISDDPAPVLTSTPVVTFEVDPAPEPVPALKYRLLPPLSELKPGNAAPIYLRPLVEGGDVRIEQLLADVSRLLDLPAEKRSVEELDSFVEQNAVLFSQIAVGARRDRCDWEYTYGEDFQDPVLFQLNDTVQVRNYAHLLIVKIRGEVLAGRFDEAIHTLQTGFAIARHLAGDPLSSMIALTIVNKMLDAIQEFVVQPGAPNLYWALAALPRPLVELDAELQLERGVLAVKFPELRDLDRRRSEQEWQQIETRIRDWSKVLEAYTVVVPTDKSDRDAEHDGATVADARAFLAEHTDKTDTEITVMSDAEVTVRYTLLVQQYLFDMSSKYAYLPIASAAESLDADEARRQMARELEMIPLCEALTSEVIAVNQIHAFRDRRLALLQTVEALRLYAAEHDGELPERLDQLFPPAPENPITGEPFEYTLLEDGTGQIKSPPPAGANPIPYGIDWRIKVRKPAAK